MKTFEFPLNSMLSNGLRTEEEAKRNGSNLTTVSNARCSKDALVQADKLVRTFALDVDGTIFPTYKGIFILTGTALYSYENYILTSLLTGLEEGGLWSIADFGDYILFTNGVINLVRNATTGVFSVDNGIVFPIAKTICAHRGRLILGGRKNYPETLKNFPDWVAWSDINSLEFLSEDSPKQARQNLAGYMPMDWKGEILKVLPLGNKIIVYGDNGITAMPLVSSGSVASTYSYHLVHNAGIKEQGAVTSNAKEGNETMHYFIDKYGWLYSVDLNLKVEKLGYKEFLS